MVLTPGTRLGPYEVTAQIGVGGMGEVYRATDTNLKRQVAIKVLPASVAADVERLARFQREAEVLAALNHPNIAAIYGLERSGTTTALVMELVEGPTLEERIAKGAVPVDEALPVAKQVTDALEAAHERGIIHRDLKPANIKVRADGTVKVLDFGLAKAMDAAGGGQPAAGGQRAADPSMSPTITPTMTHAGMILGTAAYMSPEQARGKTVDKRADIWAFGCVLYEMLTGTRLFAGDSVAETLGLIFAREPDLAALPATTPAGVRRVIARCLVKDPRRRLRDIGDARLDLEGAPDADGAAASGPTRAIWRVLPWGLAVAGVLLAGWTFWSRSAGSLVPQVTHVDVGFPPGVEPYATVRYELSPDGRMLALVVVGMRDGVRRVLIRRLDRAEVTEIPDTPGASAAVFSPDGGSVAILLGNGVITRVSLTDQQRKVVTSGADLIVSITWSPAGIVFDRGGQLWIVSPESGAARALTVLDAARHEVLHHDPVVLPGERLVLFASQTTELDAERIEVVSIDGGPRSVVVERAQTPLWSPTGHLLFARDGAVLAAAMDARTGKLLGPAVPVIRSGVVQTLYSGNLGLTVSPSGTLLYMPVGFVDGRVVSVGRDGAALAVDLPSAPYANPRISPDGRRLLVENGSRIIEALDLTRGTRARLSAAATNMNFPAWSADGSRVVFRRFAAPFWAAADGSGDPKPVPGGTLSDYPSSPGPDPDSFIAVRIRPETSGDVFLMSTTGAFPPKPLIVTPSYDGGAQLSPDDRWLLYQSDASGRAEIYVRRYPALDRQWQVSEGGGVQPRWSRNSREIYYRSSQHIVAVALDASGPEPVFGKPTPLFADEYDFASGNSIANYDVTPDGRFLMIRRDTSGGELHVVVNWTEELKGILAAGGVH